MRPPHLRDLLGLCLLLWAATPGWCFLGTSLHAWTPPLAKGFHACGNPQLLRMSGDQVKTGCLIVYERNGKKSLGLVGDRDGKKSWKIDDGERISLVAPRDIQLVLPGGSSYGKEDVRSMEAAARSHADDTLPELAWETLIDEGGGALTLQEYAELALGASEEAECVLASYLMLEDGVGKVFFKALRDGSYEARPKGVVEGMIAQRKAELAAQQRWQDMLDWLANVLKSNNGRASEPVNLEECDEQRQEALKALMRYGATCMDKVKYGAEQPRPDAATKLAQELLGSLGRVASATNAFKLCVQLGLFSEHENLFVWGSLSRSCSPSAMEHAEQLLKEPPPDPDAATRLDLTHLKAYAIDSADTVEVDDAVSIETLEDGTERIWVHIADVSRWIEEESALASEAEKRQQTIYLPEGSITMLPIELADLLSLNPGAATCAFSLGIDLAEDGSIVSMSLHPTTIKVTYRLTYDEVDEMLYEGIAAPGGEEEDLGKLAKWARTRLDYRIANGSVDRFSRAPKAEVKVSEDNQEWIVKVTPEQSERTSNQLVTELMVLSGEAIALLGKEHGISLPFRTQRAPDNFPDDAWFEELPEKYCRAAASYRFMTGARVNTEPGPHWGLGVQAYTQWSSPIRRMTDLNVHYQLKKFLRGEPTRPSMASLVLSGEGSVAGTIRAQRKSERYWLIEYLRRAMLDGKEFSAYVLSFRDGSDSAQGIIYDLYLTELGQTVRHIEQDESLKLGDEIMVFGHFTPALYAYISASSHYIPSLNDNPFSTIHRLECQALPLEATSSSLQGSPEPANKSIMLMHHACQPEAAMPLQNMAWLLASPIARKQGKRSGAQPTLLVPCSTLAST
ncbi:unnamed protein product [Chrysoparadoxa australica]